MIIVVSVGGAPAGAGHGGEVPDVVVGVIDRAAGAVGDAREPAGGILVMERDPGAGGGPGGVQLFYLAQAVVVGRDEGARLVDIEGEQAPEGLPGRDIVGEDERSAVGGRFARKAAVDIIILALSVFGRYGVGPVRVLREGLGLVPGRVLVNRKTVGTLHLGVNVADGYPLKFS